jgi:hypothetical protein
MGKHPLTKTSEKRFAAKLLFQFRVVVEGDSGKRRLCEERIVSLTATGGKAALREAKRKGYAAQYKYKNTDGNPVCFEFVGVLELLCPDPGCEADEVWYEIVERILPMERKHRLIPPEKKLSAIRNKE